MSKKILGALVTLVFVLGFCWFIYALTGNKLSIGYNIGYQPDQPIPFSHKIHAGQYGIDCTYCHTTAAVSRHSAVPSMNICMNCHLSVMGSDQKISGKTTQEWIQTLSTQYANNEPVSWTKVHLLPDHVKFNHSRHIAAGKACQTCHGPVETMETVYQYSDLSMGWCVNCHRGTTDESLTKEMLDEYKKSGHMQAPINCSTCHY